MLNFFPKNKRIGWNTKKSQTWDTISERTASGQIRTLTNQLYPLWEIEASCILTDEEERELHGFFASRKGGLEPFLWLDAEDCQVNSQILKAIEPGIYQCVMIHGNFIEPVDYVDNLKVYIDGKMAASSSYTVQNGRIKFKQVPSGAVTADYRYYWKMRFSQGTLKIEKTFKNINKTSFKLEVVR